MHGKIESHVKKFKIDIFGLKLNRAGAEWLKEKQSCQVMRAIQIVLFRSKFYFFSEKRQGLKFSCAEEQLILITGSGKTLHGSSIKENDSTDQRSENVEQETDSNSSPFVAEDQGIFVLRKHDGKVTAALFFMMWDFS